MHRSEHHRQFFAKLMLAASGGKLAVLEDAVAAVPREDFLGQGPWQIFINGEYLETPSDDPAYIYNNYLVALDADKGINNGEPFLHARWINGIAPIKGEVVCHIGAGTGYYTALFSRMVAPGGHVHAYEVEPTLARRAELNLSEYENVLLHAADATNTELPTTNVIYVNAGLAAPPVQWLTALEQGGRMIFPWRPNNAVGVALIVTRRKEGWAVTPLMPSLFIPCVGVTSTLLDANALRPFDAWQARALHLRQDREPDEHAVAVSESVWFSRKPLN